MFRTGSLRSKQSSSGKHSLCVLNDSTILSLIRDKDLIKPFEPELISCDGVDLQLANEYYLIKCADKVFDTHSRNSPRAYYHKSKNSNLLINPSERFLVCSIEEFNMPNDIVGIVGLRSSYSRLGLQMPTGFISPGFIGQLTLEISGGSFPIRLYAGDRMFQVIFASLNRPSERPYNGKYQNQIGATLPIFHCNNPNSM